MNSENKEITVLGREQVFDVYKYATHKTEKERRLYEQFRRVLEASNRLRKYNGYSDRRRGHTVNRNRKRNKARFETVKLSNYNERTGQVERYKLSWKEQQNEAMRLAREQYNIHRTFMDHPEEIVEGDDVLLSNVWEQLPEWLKIYRCHTERMKKPNLERHIRTLQELARTCVSMDPKDVVRTTRYRDFGNCGLCFRKGRVHSRCMNERCQDGLYGRVVVFKNFNHQYINPDIVHLTLNDALLPTEYAEREDIDTPEVILPVEHDEYRVYTATEAGCLCEYKLLWYAHMHDERDTYKLLHVMNEVIVMYNLLRHVFMINNRLKRFCINVYENREVNGTYRKIKWYGWWYHYSFYSWGIDTNYKGRDLVLSRTILGIPIVNILYQQALLQRTVEQQERDGENANLVQEENYDVQEENHDVQENNDARRDREDEDEEERNVRQRRGSP